MNGFTNLSLKPMSTHCHFFSVMKHEHELYVIANDYCSHPHGPNTSGYLEFLSMVAFRNFSIAANLTTHH